MDTIVAFGVGAALLAGIAGAFVTRIPGVPLSWAATVVWASIDESPIAWLAVGVATVAAITNYLIQHRMSGGAWSELMIADRSWLIGAGAGIAGALLAKLPGLIFGFVGGTYVAERRRLRLQGTARNAAGRPDAPCAAVLSRTTLAEFATAAAIGAAWVWAFAG